MFIKTERQINQKLKGLSYRKKSRVFRVTLEKTSW